MPWTELTEREIVDIVYETYIDTYGHMGIVCAHWDNGSNVEKKNYTRTEKREDI